MQAVRQAGSTWCLQCTLCPRARSRRSRGQGNGGRGGPRLARATSSIRHGLFHNITPQTWGFSSMPCALPSKLSLNVHCIEAQLVSGRRRAVPPAAGRVPVPKGPQPQSALFWPVCREEPPL